MDDWRFIFPIRFINLFNDALNIFFINANNGIRNGYASVWYSFV